MSRYPVCTRVTLRSARYDTCTGYSTRTCMRTENDLRYRTSTSELYWTCMRLGTEYWVQVRYSYGRLIQCLVILYKPYTDSRRRGSRGLRIMSSSRKHRGRSRSRERYRNYDSSRSDDDDVAYERKRRRSRSKDRHHERYVDCCWINMIWFLLTFVPCTYFLAEMSDQPQKTIYTWKMITPTTKNTKRERKCLPVAPQAEVIKTKA